MEADPRRPWKLYACMASATLGSLLATNALHGIWVHIVTAIIAGIAVYITPNPTRNKKNAPARGRNSSYTHERAEHYSDGDVPLGD